MRRLTATQTLGLVAALASCTPIGPDLPEQTASASSSAQTGGDSSPTTIATTTSEPDSDATATASDTQASDAGATTDHVMTNGETTPSTSTATDAVTSTSAESTSGDTCTPDPGTPMGPCRLLDDPAGACDPDLLCHLTPDGSFCQPTCTSCGSAELDACIDALSTAGRFTCFAGQGCALPCASDDQCVDPLVCAKDADGNRSCVWPGEPTGPGACSHLPGALFGPCVDGFCGVGNCLPTESGDMCVPDCETCVDPGNVACSADLTTTDGVGLLCHSIAPGCSVPCVFTSPDTHTCDGGTVCDPHFNVCVWP